MTKKPARKPPRVLIPDVHVRRSDFAWLRDNCGDRVDVYQVGGGYVQIDSDAETLEFSPVNALQLAEVIRRLASGESLEDE